MIVRAMLDCRDMKTLSISVKHVASAKSQPCAACGAVFVPAEDTGSRVLSIKAPEEQTVRRPAVRRLLLEVDPRRDHDAAAEHGVDVRGRHLRRGAWNGPMPLTSMKW